MRCGFLCGENMTDFEKKLIEILNDSASGKIESVEFATSNSDSEKEGKVIQIIEVYKGYIHLLDRFVGAVVIVAIDYMDWFNSLFNRGKG